MTSPRSHISLLAPLAIGTTLTLALFESGCDLGVRPDGAGGFDDPGGPDSGLVRPGERYHPAGYAAANAHGLESNQQAQNCRGCHGGDLTGIGAAASCDSCHTPGDPTAWRTDCTFCHGGVNDQTGAPPRNIDLTTDVQAGTFPPHGVHVRGGMAAAFDCSQCHVKASDVLTVGHAFDDTAGVAEVDMGGGLSAQAAYSRTGGCANVYCHGDGRADNGRVAVSAGAMSCTSCHAGMTSGRAGWGTMSGYHSLHLGESATITCGDCHKNVTTNGTAIANASLHVDGARNVAFTASVTFDAGAQTCTGSCHGFSHNRHPWSGGGDGERFHPVGYSEPLMHGADMELQRLECRSCHGNTLTGGATGPSCDGCHQQNWRTNCTYCHGGELNQTGAPPRDLGLPTLSASLSFRAHTAHVTSDLMPPMDCAQCHRKPTDVLSAGHAFDDTTGGVAEVDMSRGRSATGTYNGAGTCSTTYCHGNGRGANGQVADGEQAMTCSSCHAGMNNSTLWSTMSGDHRMHLRMGYDCGDCHQSVSPNGTVVANPSLHIDGQVRVAFTAAGFTYNSATKTCNGNCHEGHNNDRW